MPWPLPNPRYATLLESTTRWNHVTTAVNVNFRMQCGCPGPDSRSVNAETHSSSGRRRRAPAPTHQAWAYTFTMESYHCAHDSQTGGTHRFYCIFASFTSYAAAQYCNEQVIFPFVNELVARDPRLDVPHSQIGFYSFVLCQKCLRWRKLY